MEAAKDLIFVSANKREFSDPSNETKLHQDILDQYPELNITYAIDVSHLIYRLTNESNYPKAPEGVSSLEPPSGISNFLKIRTKTNRLPLEIDKSKSLLDQMHSVLSFLHKEVGVSVPPRIIATEYPFSDDNQQSTYSNFILDVKFLQTYIKLLNRLSMIRWLIAISISRKISLIK